jgi:uncharacterized membrane protein YkvA (DUF1232 family)
MTVRYADFKETMTTELIDFVRSQASALSVADLDQLVAALPALAERFSTIPSQTYPYLSDQLEFLSLLVKDEFTGPNRYPTSQRTSEAAFALLYFQSVTDLIPDTIPGMGLLDDAMIASLVLRRHEDAFKRSSYAYKICWPLPTFDIDQLHAVVSPLRLDSFHSSSFCKSVSKPNVGPSGSAPPSIISDEGDGLRRTANSFFWAVRVFLSGLVDRSAFQHISLNREVSVVFTSTGPLLYRCEMNNPTNTDQGSSPVTNLR